MKYVDIHSHILPAMDDGSKSMEQSLAMLKLALEEDIGTILATPHNMPGKGCPGKAVVTEKIGRLKAEAERAGLPIKILSGSEYFYREEILSILERGEVVTLANTDRVLIEFDPGADRKYIRNAVREVLSVGYVPVIAHTERCFQLMEKHFDTITEMRKMGALIQVNTDSVTGGNGWKARKDTRTMLKTGLVDLLGSDAHSDGRRAPRMKECADYLRKKLPGEYAERLLKAEELGLPAKLSEVENAEQYE